MRSELSLHIGLFILAFSFSQARIIRTPADNAVATSHPKKTESNRSRSNPQGAKAESFMSPSSKSQEAASEDTKRFHKISSRKLLTTNTRFFLEAAAG